MKAQPRGGSRRASAPPVPQGSRTPRGHPRPAASMLSRGRDRRAASNTWARRLALAPPRRLEVAPPAVGVSVFLSIPDRPPARSQLARPPRRLDRARPCLKRQDSVPVSMMWARWVRRSTTALARRGSGKILVHSPKGRLVVTISEALVALGDHLEDELGRSLGQRQVAELIEQQQLDPGVAGDDPLQLAARLGLLQLVGEGGERREAHPPSLLAGADRERDREVRLAGAGRVGVALLTLSIRCRSACASWRRPAICTGWSWGCSAGPPSRGRRRSSVGCSTAARARSRRAGRICRCG
jgi:hypothetical protein